MQSDAGEEFQDEASHRNRADAHGGRGMNEAEKRANDELVASLTGERDEAKAAFANLFGIEAARELERLHAALGEARALVRDGRANHGVNGCFVNGHGIDHRCWWCRKIDAQPWAREG
jgi:hypothetical protein